MTQQIEIVDFGHQDVEAGFGNSLTVKVDGHLYRYEEWVADSTSGADLYDAEAWRPVPRPWPVKPKRLEKALAKAAKAYDSTLGLAEVIAQAKLRARNAAHDAMSLRWTYMGVNVYPSGPNSQGIRWTADCGRLLRSQDKAGMRELIRHYK